jgi:hypothetical protein
MSTIVMKEDILVVVLDDLDVGIIDVVLKQRCSIGMPPLIELQKGV